MRAPGILKYLTVYLFIHLLSGLSYSSELPSHNLCREIIFSKLSEGLGELYKAKLVSYEDLIKNEFEIPSEMGQFYFRAKAGESINSKLTKNKWEGDSLYHLNKWGTSVGGKFQVQIEALTALMVPDGLAGRIVLTDTSDTGMKIFEQKLMKTIKKGKLRIVSIKNYHQLNTPGYIDSKTLSHIKYSELNQFRPVLIFNGKAMRHPLGYLSTHLNIWIPKVGFTEIQIRGGMMNKLAEILHIFYDIKMGKKLADSYQKIPEIVNIKQQIQQMNEGEIQHYLNYTKSYYEFIRKLEKNEVSLYDYPRLPLEISHYPELDIRNLWPKIKSLYFKNYPELKPDAFFGIMVLRPILLNIA